MATGLVYSDCFLRHDTGEHPERAERLSLTAAGFREQGLWDAFVHLDPAPISEQALLACHRPEQIGAARSTAARGGWLDSDTPVSRDSFQAACLAAGGALEAADAVMRGRLENAFCLVRPPGHHATPERSMGFCLFNNVALAARHLQTAHGLERILIVDFDVHHGNGTQDAFYSDPGVLFFSLHRYPFYPGTGAEGERGEGPGKGFTVNVPLARWTTAADYLGHLERFLSGQARDYRPEFVLVSAGFDGYVRDPLGAFCLEAEHFREITLRLRDLASECCAGRLVSTLEGGYNLRDLPGLMAAHAGALLE